MSRKPKYFLQTNAFTTHGIAQQLGRHLGHDQLCTYVSATSKAEAVALAEKVGIWLQASETRVSRAFDTQAMTEAGLTEAGRVFVIHSRNSDLYEVTGPGELKFIGQFVNRGTDEHTLQLAK